MKTAGATGFWQTVRVLLRTARARGVARSRRQMELLYHRTRSEDDVLSGLGTAMVFVVMGIVHGLFGHTLTTAIKLATRLEVEQAGKLVVSHGFVDRCQANPNLLESVVGWEARERARALGGTREQHARLLYAQLNTKGRDGFVEEDDVVLARPTTPLALAIGALVLVWWFLMMAFQGEGLEIDYQKRRHPMWEWLFAHPVRPGAVFLAEMLTPMAANPVFVTAPVFFLVAFSTWHSWQPSLLAAMLVGLPIAVAASCMSKTAEIACMLRLSPRSRGAVLGILSWLGYASFVLAFMLAGGAGSLLMPVLRWLQPWSSAWHAPLLAWALGLRRDGTMSLTAATLAGLAFAALVIAGCVWVSARATRVGLAGGFGGSTQVLTVRDSEPRWRLLRDPLLRKELLWFWRDRGAVVQVILIPLTIGLMQAYNLRGLAMHATEAWHYLCGLAVVCGTYFLLVLGPRSLTSEGPALWITLTWPRGLESLLQAKARLWSLIATALVSVVMIYAMVKFPADAWKIALVAAAWWFFAHSLGQKAVTLVAAPSSSGEPTPVPRARRWAAMLGTFSFASGILTQNWHLAALGVVFSSLSSAAMWQNFRARIPFLFDPWSEKLPPAPTLMHAMIAIVAMVDGMGVVALLLMLFLGQSARALAVTAAYGLVGLATWWVMRTFLKSRGVAPAAVWRWQDHDAARLVGRVPLLDRIDWSRRSPAIAAAFLGAVAMALLASGYLWLLAQFPSVARYMESSTPDLGHGVLARLSFLFLAVVCAPLAEEYLFRGLLYRALDREWGGWKAVLGSALFFTIYHQPLGWPVVMLVGIFNALLFKLSGRLAPCVVAHLSYNAVVSLLPWC
ncbi:MAG: CPBP family intramembrane glutamic endopeptidase [Planctomycetota bacterium]